LLITMEGNKLKFINISENSNHSKVENLFVLALTKKLILKNIEDFEIKQFEGGFSEDD